MVNYNVVCFPFSDIEVPQLSEDDIQGDREKSEENDGSVESGNTRQREDSPEDTGLSCMGSYSHNILNNTNDTTVIFEILDTVPVIQFCESCIRRSNI